MTNKSDAIYERVNKLSLELIEEEYTDAMTTVVGLAGFIISYFAGGSRSRADVMLNKLVELVRKCPAYPKETA
jgi:hypothetical protein